MTKRYTWILVGFVLIVGSGTAQSAERVEITGRVQDPAGEPVAGVTVSSYWISEEGRWVTRKGVRTDELGHFELKEYLSSRPRSLMVFDETQEHGAVTTLDAASAGKPLLLKLAPTTRVAAAIESTALGWPIESTFVSFTALPAKIALASHRGASSLSLRLPRGDYGVRISAVDCRRVARRLTLTRDMPAFDLGTMDLEPTIIAQHYGKKPPAWKVSDARGVDPRVTLADFKGKWVLLEFWGYW